MTAESAVYRRVLRRQRYSPRTGAAVVVAAAASVLGAAGIVLAMWCWADPAVRERVDRLVGSLSQLGGDRAVVTAIGVVAVLLSLLLIAMAVLPGRRARHTRMTGRVALSADDGVLADASADAVAAACGLSSDRVSVSVRPRSATVRVVPLSGVRVHRDIAAESAKQAIAAAGFAVTSRVLVDHRAVVA
ncbi:hypothetical protein ET475_11095 [Microbacterium protaetiae]|uniref:DNA/RNA endonuclease G n=1 Tax=Microbacterium protaetiae TaxID=2509458 RepID=A0A4P6EK21_9MICO|nr:hypothetical protein [Microbacterium protaetiae]QAY60477.1 hypothetical protein ET475_11095 [Microbacterium protaetiae]